MARPKTPEQKAFCIQRIIELTRRHGRLTVGEATAMLGLYRGTTEKYFHEAAARAGLIRYGRCGLFRDQRAVIDFDLKRFSYAPKAAAKEFKPDVFTGPVMRRVKTICGAFA